MARVRAKIVKVLEDGTEITLVDVFDHPWFVSPILKRAAIQVHEPAPAAFLQGQQTLEVV